MSQSIQGPRDRQIYAWENAVIAPLDRSWVDLRTARAIVDHVWSERGLSHPPRVEGAKIGGGYADRMCITLSDKGVPTWVVLHELAHSMDFSLEISVGMYADRPDGETLTGSTHDANWTGIYLDLMNDFMPSSFNKLWLMKTLTERRLDYSLCPTIRSK